MKIKLRINATRLILVLSLLVLVPPSADAQLLNKISKGLGKVSKTIEKATKQIEEVDKTLKKGKDKNPAPKSPTSSNEQANHNSDYNNNWETESEENVSQAPSTPGFLSDAKQPAITSKTLLLKRRNNFVDNTHNPVSDGVFAVQETNRNYGYGYYYGFWTIDGKRLTEARYESPDGYPVFDSGAVVLRDQPNAQHYKPFIILYNDGTALKLPENFSQVTQFHDGVATAETKGTAKKKSERYCIDIHGKHIWPNLDSPTQAVLEVGYLNDGLRRVLIRFEYQPYRYNSYYGFIDNNGEWVIEPNIKLATEFKNGYCYIKDKNDKLKIIDTKGNIVCQLPDNWSIDELGHVSDGYFVRQEVKGADCTYYDLQGNAVKTYKKASDFKNGYAFIVEDYGCPVCVINTKFEVVKTLVAFNSPSEWVGINNPEFGKAGLGTLVQSIVVTPEGDAKIYVSDKSWQSYVGDFWQSHIGNFLPGDYAPATIIFDDQYGSESYGWSGFIDKNGDFAVVITEDERAFRKLPGEMVDGEYKVSLPQFDTIPIGPKFINK